MQWNQANTNHKPYTGYRELRSVFQLSPLTQQPVGQYYLRCVNAIDFVVPGTRRKDPGWKMEWVMVKGNWGAFVRYGHRERTIPTSFGPQPKWAKEEDEAAIMSFLALIKQAGYQHAGMEGFPWERARVEHSLLAIDAVSGDLFFVLLLSFCLF